MREKMNAHLDQIECFPSMEESMWRLRKEAQKPKTGQNEKAFEKTQVDRVKTGNGIELSSKLSNMALK